MLYHLLQHYQAQVIFIVVVHRNKTAAEFLVNILYN